VQGGKEGEGRRREAECQKRFGSASRRSGRRRWRAGSGRPVSSVRRGCRRAGGDGSNVRRSAPKKRSGGIHRVWRTARRALVGGEDEAEAVTRWGSCSALCEAAGGGAMAPHRRAGAVGG
jgi:hypothetical protein